MSNKSFVSPFNRLKSLDPKLLLAVVIAVALAIIMLAIVSRFILKEPAHDTSSTITTLPYWKVENEPTTFEWQPATAEEAIEVTGTRYFAGRVSNDETGPGTALVNEGYLQIELEQALTSTQAKTGFQKGNEVCVVTTAYSAGAAGLEQARPDLDYETVCGTL